MPDTTPDNSPMIASPMPVASLPTHGVPPLAGTTFYLQILLQILLTTSPAQDQITASLVIALDLLNFRRLQIHGIQLDRPLQHRSAAARVATQLRYYQLQSNLQQETFLALLFQMSSRSYRHLMPTLLWYSLLPLTALAIRRLSLMAVT